MNHKEELNQSEQQLEQRLEKHRIIHLKRYNENVYDLDLMAEDFSLMSDMFACVRGNCIHMGGKHEEKIASKMSSIKDYDDTILTANLNNGEVRVINDLDILKYIISPKDTKLQIISSEFICVDVFVKKDQRFLLNIPLWITPCSDVRIKVDSDIKQLQYTGVWLDINDRQASMNKLCVNKYFGCYNGVLVTREFFNGFCRSVPYEEIIAAIYDKNNRTVDKNSALYRAMRSGMFERLLFTDKRYIKAYI